MKYTSILVLFLFIFTPFLAMAQLVPCVDAPCKFSDLAKLLDNVFTFLIKLVIPLATGSIAVAGIMYVSGGAFGSVDKAKEIFKFAVGGLILALASYLIVETILTFLTGGTSLLKTF